MTEKIFLAALCVLTIDFAKCDKNGFRIRKCCPENELILERTGQCIDVSKAEAFTKRPSDSFRYYFENEFEISFDKFLNNGVRPWWFPSGSRIMSKKTNQNLTKFPYVAELIMGKRQPCDDSVTSLLPSYFYNYNFYDDGSLLVERYGHHQTDMLYDPMTFCVDLVEPPLKLENRIEDAKQPNLEFYHGIEYMVILCPCEKSTCVLKCCEPPMIMDLDVASKGESPCVLETNVSDIWVPDIQSSEDNSTNYYLLFRFPQCPPGESAVLPNLKEGDKQQYTIYSNGSAQISGETYMSNPLQFCGEKIQKGSSKLHDYIIRCYPENGIPNKWMLTRKILYGSLSVIGAFFFLLTLLVYAMLPTIKNINDRNLVSQTWSLFVGYICIAISQLIINYLPQEICVFVGFLTQYSFLAAFFWLNVLCIDISWTFSELRLIRGIPTERIRKKFIYYSLYAWGCPALISLVTATIEFIPINSKYILKPEIREKCWFPNDSLAKFAYFYGPIAVLLMANIFLFLFTLFRILQTQRDTSYLIKNKNTDRQRFILYLKLFLLMGLSWITELISYAVGGPDYYWYLPDIVNLLRAVFMFIILCCKPEVKEELKRRLKPINGAQVDVRRPSNPRTNSFYLTTTQLNSDEQKIPTSADSSL